MTLDDFRAGLDRHGTDLARWPALAALRARRLLATSGIARAELERAQQLEARLRASLQAAAPAGEGLRLRLKRIPQHHARSAALLRPARPATVPGLRRGLYAGAALGLGAAVIGFAAGFSGLFAPESSLDWAGLAYGVL